MLQIISQFDFIMQVPKCDSVVYKQFISRRYSLICEEYSLNTESLRKGIFVCNREIGVAMNKMWSTDQQQGKIKMIQASST